MDHAIQSLIYVVEQSAAQVRAVGERLKTASPKQMEPLLRGLAKEADTLSAGLTRLSQHVEEIPVENEVKGNNPPTPDPRLLTIARLGQKGLERGFCAQCGGVNGT